MKRTWQRPELIKARKILAELYETRDAARTLLKDANIATGNISFEGGATQMWATALDVANNHYAVDALIETALAEHTERDDLAALLPQRVVVTASLAEAQLGDNVARLAASGLEKVLRRDVPNFNLTDLLAKLGAIAARVCRIELGGRAVGTGFLVGPACVMTNYHVMQPVLESRVAPSEVTVRFGYHDAGGDLLRLAPVWNVAHARYADFEATRPDAGVPSPDELDYAVVRVEGVPGAAPAAEGAPPRGWMELPTGSLALQPDEPLLIVQHPQGRPMEIAVETRGVASFNSNRTRVKHRVNTEGGSSGSPVFDFRCSLVALHHAGDVATLPVFNQAVPIDAIRAHLARTGRLDELAR